MFAEKNPDAWSDLLDFLAERVADDILAERAEDRIRQQSAQESTQTECVH
jgi:hypothetical protein